MSLRTAPALMFVWMVGAGPARAQVGDAGSEAGVLEAWVHEDGGWTRAGYFCDAPSEVVYAAGAMGPQVELVRRGKHGGVERVALEGGKSQGAAGTEGWTYPADAGVPYTLGFHPRELYPDAWDDRSVFRGPQDATNCRYVPRGLASCTTSRRSAYVDVDTQRALEYQSFDFASAPDAGTAEPVASTHVVGGKASLSHGEYRVAFVQGGYQYVLAVSSQSAAPGAHLDVFKGKKRIQTEACWAYTVHPSALAPRAGKPKP